MRSFSTTLFIMGLGLMSTGIQLDAQTMFIRPDTTPNYASYVEVDECLAAVRRLDSEYRRAHETIWRDTAEYDSVYFHGAVGASVVKRIEQCLTYISIDTLPLEGTHSFARHLLFMNRDDDVRRLYGRYFESVAPEKYQEEVGEALRVYSDARPRRMAQVKQLYQLAASKIPADSTLLGIRLRILCQQIAMEADDKEFFDQVYDDMHAIGDSAAFSRLNRFEKNFLLDAGAERHITALGDSLKISTEKYHKFLKLIGDPIQKGIADRYPRQRAEVNGDFWFQSGANVGSDGSVLLTDQYRVAIPEARPVPGKINLVLSMQGGCHTSTPGINARVHRRNGPIGCWRLFSAIRRMKKAYPELEITIVSSTFGFFADAPPLEPADEADSIAKYFLGFNKLPATLVVQKTNFFRLPGYDQRRVDIDLMKTVISESRYRGNKSLYIIDEAGSLILIRSLDGAEGARGERFVFKYLDILFERLALTGSEPLKRPRPALR